MATTVKQSIGPLEVDRWHSKMTPEDLALQRAINNALRTIVTAVDNRMGFRGAVAIHNIVDTKGNPVTIGPATATSHAVQAGQTILLTNDAQQETAGSNVPPELRGPNVQGWDMQGKQAFNGADADHPADLVTYRQLLAVLRGQLLLTNIPPTTINAGDTTALGLDPRAAHGDHRHAVHTAAVTDIHSLGVKSAGSGSTLPRGDHVHDVSVVPTASLLAPPQDGLVLMENTGSTLNWVMYGAGLRVRVGGGINVYSNTFAAQTSVTVTGATHGLGTGIILVSLWDTTVTPELAIAAEQVTVNRATGDVVMSFGSVSTSARYFILAH